MDEKKDRLLESIIQGWETHNKKTKNNWMT